MSLVQVVESHLYQADVVASKTSMESYEKKSITANLFAQELGLLVDGIGELYDGEIITLPSWSANSATRGLSFQTRLSSIKSTFILSFVIRYVNASSDSAKPSSPVKWGSYAQNHRPKGVAGPIPVALWGNDSGVVVSCWFFSSYRYSVPLIDARNDNFDCDTSIKKLIRSRENVLKSEVPKDSLGVVFYTISDEGGPDTIAFNVQAFALLETQ